MYNQPIISVTPRYMNFPTSGFYEAIWIANTIRAVGNAYPSVNLDRNSGNSYWSVSYTHLTLPTKA